MEFDNYDDDFDDDFDSADTDPQETYAVTNMQVYTRDVRLMAADEMGFAGKASELDDYVSLGQVENFVHLHCHGYDEQGHPLLSVQDNFDIFSELYEMLEGVATAKLCGLDLVECAWDSESNEMIFWQKDTAQKTDKSNP